MASPRSIAIVGAGNVARSLASALARVAPLQIYSRTPAHAAAVAAEVEGASVVGSLNDIDADVIIIAVADDAIARVAAELGERPEALVLHTSGSVGMETLAPVSPRHGVLYPLQTFTAGRHIDISEVPFFIEGSNPQTVEETGALARRLSPKVREADSARRREIHIAAVFAANFTNHLWTIADERLRASGLDLTLLRPLISETLDKAMEQGAAQGQTGPARRGDLGVIESHLDRLEGFDRDIYSLISRSIINRYRK